MARIASRIALTFAVAAGLALAAQPRGAAAAGREKAPAGESKVDRGRYLVKIAGCNDCHTAGYAAAAGNVPESAWLTGDTLGWRGAWGTTYAANLLDNRKKPAAKLMPASARREARK